RVRVKNKYLTSALTYGAVAGLTATLAPMASLLSLRNPKDADKLIRFYARTILASADVRVDAAGVENVPAEGQFILVANHQSHFDALVILSLVERHLRFVAKSELYKIPIFGPALRLTGNLKVERTGGDKDRETLRQAADEVRNRVSIVFFAEGTRSDDGILRPFKKGAALLARMAQVPLLPFAVAGTKDILPKGGRMVQGEQRVVARIGKPIPTLGRTPDELQALTDEVRAAVAKLLAEA
ncbi:MAG: lysophospholipid acyltransferase family protein, partial [Myxococcaceae bacterium]